MTMITGNTASVAKGLGNILINHTISMPAANYPFTNVATKMNLAAYSRLSEVYSLTKQHPITITPTMMAPADISIRDDYRSITPTLTSANFSVTLHPATIDISLELAYQSAINYKRLATETLARYCLDLREIKLKEVIDVSATAYECQFGAQPGIPTEVSLKDLDSISARLRASGMAPLLSQYLASVGIGTSPVPKCFPVISSATAIQEMIHTLGYGESTNRRFISGYQYSGSSNFAFNVIGCDAIANMCFITSTNYVSSTPSADIYMATLVSADSIYMASSTPIQDFIYDRDPMILSPIGIISQLSTACPFAAVAARPEGLIKISASFKKTT